MMFTKSMIVAILLVSQCFVFEVFSDDAKTSIEATTYYRSARGVISKYQKLINDADKGDKGLDGKKSQGSRLSK